MARSAQWQRERSPLSHTTTATCVTLLDEALRTIQTRWRRASHLEDRGRAAWVSRSALYRHFADKQALLATVGSEGFRKLGQVVAHAWERNGRGRIGFEAMARAYVQFAVAHPSHYRVMFGGSIESAPTDDQFVADAKAAFEVLVDALVEQRNAGDIRRDDPVLMARFVWAIEHDTAMLVIDGQLPGEAQPEALEHYAAQRTQHPSAKKRYEPSSRLAWTKSWPSKLSC